jgi:hypothetical protein
MQAELVCLAKQVDFVATHVPLSIQIQSCSQHRKVDPLLKETWMPNQEQHGLDMLALVDAVNRFRRSELTQECHHWLLIFEWDYQSLVNYKLVLQW